MCVKLLEMLKAKQAFVTALIVVSIAISVGTVNIKPSYSISSSQALSSSTDVTQQAGPQLELPTGAKAATVSQSAHTNVLKVAFVLPTFTYAAYQLNGFYNFYAKYLHAPLGANITTDLNLLTVKIPHGPFLLHNQRPGDKPGIKDQDDYFRMLMDHVESRAPNPIKISNMTDREVNDGLIFTHTNSTGKQSDRATSKNTTNAYDVLFLFHQEYATQAEYNNLKQFVENGGTIVFNDGNILTTEVKYNRVNDTVTFVRGHHWQYNGKTAWHTREAERWLNETQQWVGSNFLEVPAAEVNATFSSDHFGYKHIEEQYVTNPQDKIILDFGTLVYENLALVKYAKYANATVAAYELDSPNNNGRVIMLSIFAHTIFQNPDFLNFYDTKIIPMAFAS